MGLPTLAWCLVSMWSDRSALPQGRLVALDKNVFTELGQGSLRWQSDLKWGLRVMWYLELQSSGKLYRPFEQWTIHT